MTRPKIHICRLLAMIVVIFVLVQLSAVDAYAYRSGNDTVDITDLSTINGLSVSYSWVNTTGNGGSGSAEVSNGGIVCTAVSDSGTLRGATELTVTIRNTSGMDKILKFTLDYDYTAVNATSIESLTVDNTSVTADYLYENTLANGSSIDIVIKTNVDKNIVYTATVQLTDIRFYAEGEVTITFAEVPKSQTNQTTGTYTVDGEAPTSGTYSGDTITGLQTTAEEGWKFVGWMTTDGELLGTNPTSCTKPAANATIYPLFVPDDAAAYRVGDSFYYYWEDAMAAAIAAGADTVVVSSDGILPGGTDYNKVGNYAKESTDGTISYTVPAGITLLIPRDAANTVETTPGDDGNNTYTAPTVYRKLTMASGANITVNGTINIGGKIGTYMVATGYDLPTYVNGAPSGPLGYIDMASNSSITVNSGGSLYAWGFITGSGAVTVKENGNVYEDLQIRDYRGGDETSGMVENTSKVFPFTQYYIQNIEVPLTLEYGAKETVCMAVSVTIIGVQKENVVFIGKDAGLLRLSKGSLTKTYHGSTDRIIYDVNGDVSFANLNVSIKVSTIGTITIDSQDYVMPINSNMTLNLSKGSNVTVNQDIALLPGSQVYIAEGATCTLSTGNSIYVYDADQWAAAYVGIVNKKLNAVYYAPGRTYTRTDADLVDAAICVNGILDTSAGYFYTTCVKTDTKDADGNVVSSTYTGGGANIYSTGSGKVIMNAVTNGVTYQYKQSGTAEYVPIGVASAKLKNGDGTYEETEGCAENASYTYCQECLKWECAVAEHNNMVAHATNVELGNSLNMYFAFWSLKDENENALISDWRNYTVTITCNGSPYDEFSFVEWKEIEVGGNKGYMVIYNGLSAKQMCDGITITLYNGETVVDEWADSIRNYAMRLLESADNTYANLEQTDEDYQAKRTGIENLRKLLVDMLNYGAACQTYFGYNTSDLANTDVTGTGSDYTFDDVSTNTPGNNTYFDGSQLVTTGNIQFAVKATSSFVSGMTATYSFTNHWDDPNPTTDSLKYNSAEGYYYIDALVVADAKSEITITVGDVKYTDSIERYCARMYNKDGVTDAQKAVYLTFMRFSVSAETYLEGEGRLK